MARAYRKIILTMAATLAVIVFSISAYATDLINLGGLAEAAAAASGIQIASTGYPNNVGYTDNFKDTFHLDGIAKNQGYNYISVDNQIREIDGVECKAVKITGIFAQELKDGINDFIDDYWEDMSGTLVAPYGTLVTPYGDFYRPDSYSTTFYLPGPGVDFYSETGFNTNWHGVQLTEIYNESLDNYTYTATTPFGTYNIKQKTYYTPFIKNQLFAIYYPNTETANITYAYIFQNGTRKTIGYANNTPIQLVNTGTTTYEFNTDVNRDGLEANQAIKFYIPSTSLEGYVGGYDGDEAQDIITIINNVAPQNQIYESEIIIDEPEPTPVPTYSPVPIPTAEPVPTVEPIPTITPVPSMTPPPYEYDDTIAGTAYTELENQLNQIQTNQENAIIVSQNNTGIIQNLIIWLQNWLHPSLQAIQENIGEDVIANQNSEHHLDEMPDIFLPPLQGNNDQNDIIIQNQEEQQDSLNDLVDNTDGLEQGLNDIDLHIQQEKGVLDSIRDWLRDIYNKLGSMQLSLETILNAIKEAVQSLVNTIELAETGFMDALIDAIWTPLLPIFDKIKSGISIWHYVVEWLQCISAPFGFFWQVLVGLGSCFPMPIYAVAAATIVLAVYRRFGR